MLLTFITCNHITGRGKGPQGVGLLQHLPAGLSDVCVSLRSSLRVLISCFPSACGWGFHRAQGPDPSNCRVWGALWCTGVFRSGRVWYHYFCDEIHESLLCPLLLAGVKHAPDRLVSGFGVGSVHPHSSFYLMKRFTILFPPPSSFFISLSSSSSFFPPLGERGQRSLALGFAV